MLKIELSPAFGGTGRIWLQGAATLTQAQRFELVTTIQPAMDAMCVWGGADKRDDKRVGEDSVLDMLSWEIDLAAMPVVVLGLVRLLQTSRLPLENGPEACAAGRNFTARKAA